MIELKEGMSVYTPAGEELGKINRFILDPATNEVTHIVVQKGWLLPEDKVLPFQIVRSESGERAVLNEEIDDFDQLPPFEEMHFIRAKDDEPHATEHDPYPNVPAYYWYPSHLNTGYPALGHFAWPTTETKRNVPENTVALQEGSDVISSDGEHVGDVERLFVESDSNKTTHFLISQGLLFKDRKLVPLHWVKSIEEDKVHLAVDSRLLERLPSYQE